MTSRKLLITVSCGILVGVIGPVLLVQNSESIKIRWYTWKLGSEDAAVRKKAFGWLKRLAKDNLKDKRLESFFKHSESLKQVKAEGKKSSLISVAAKGDFVDLNILLNNLIIFPF